MQYSWLAHYPKDVPHTINPDEFSSLRDLFEKTVQEHPNQIAFSNMNSPLTFQQLHSKSQIFAAYLLKELGLKKGEQVAIMMPNILQYPVALFGILCAGLTVVNINPLYTAHELTHILNDSNTKTIVILAHFAHVLQEALPQVKSLQHIIITQLGDLFPSPKKQLINFAVKYLKRMIKPYHLPAAIAFSQVLKSKANQAGLNIVIQSEDCAFLQYTGGTTGVSKGTMLTHRNIIANVLQMKEWIKKAKKIEGQRVIITPLPLYHIFSLTVNCLTFFSLGGCNVLITNPRDFKSFIKTLRNTRFTAISGVNTLYNALMNQADFSKIDFSHLSFAITGGMALQRVVAERWQQLTKMPIVEGYGLTEASPVVSANPMNILKFTGSIGFPLPSTEVSIRGEQGEELPVNQSGELWARGPQVMKGYWQNPEETAKVLTADGWLKTGDIAYINEEGEIFIVDRKKDMIIVSGFNVYPNEVEDVIAKHPGVLEVAVIGVPDAQSGEKVKAFVVKRDPTLTAEEIIKFCHEYLTRYKIPHAVEFREELPKSNVGKILRRALKAEQEQK